MYQPVIVIAIVRYPEGWRVVANGGPVGHFYDDQIGAEDLALRFATASRGSGRSVEILLQQRFGQLLPLRDIGAAAIKPWTDSYNTARPHSGINGLTPWQRVNNLLGNDS